MLAAKIIGPAASGPALRRVYILHGLLGSSRNWQSFVKGLSASLPQTEFICLDLRNHGHSRGFPPPHSLDTCVDDVLAYIQTTRQFPTALIGHSMGGKVLLQLAARDADCRRLVDKSATKHMKMFILDSSPGPKHALDAAAGDSVEKVLEIVEHAPKPIPSRAWVIDKCEKEGLDKSVAMWLSSNVAHLDGVTHGETEGKGRELHWLFDPQTGKDLYNSYLATDLWPSLIHGPISDVSIHLITASRSSRWREADVRQKLLDVQRASEQRAAAVGAGERRGAVSVEQIEAGHWVHADNPHGLSKMLLKSLQDY